MQHLWTRPRMQEAYRYFGTGSRLLPSIRPVHADTAAGLDEIRGSTPNQGDEHCSSVLHTGLADPGPTCHAIISSIALATSEPGTPLPAGLHAAVGSGWPEVW